MTENKRIHVPDNRSSSLNMPLTLRQQHWEIHKFSSIKNYILYSRLINSFSLFLKIIWWNEQSKVLSHNKSELLVSLLWLLSSLRPGQKFRYHLPDGPEGHATEDALMLCPQLKHSIHNPLSSAFPSPLTGSQDHPRRDETYNPSSDFRVYRIVCSQLGMPRKPPKEGNWETWSKPVLSVLMSKLYLFDRLVKPVLPC